MELELNPQIQLRNRALVKFPAIDPTGGSHPSLSFLFRAHNGTPAGPMADRPVYARAWSVIKGPPSQYSFYLRPVFGIFFWELQICRAHKYQAPQFITAVSFGISKISTAPLSLSHLAFSSSSSPSRRSGRGSVSAIPRAVFCGCRRLASGGSHIRRRRLVRSFFLVYQIDGWRTSSDPPSCSRFR